MQGILTWCGYVGFLGPCRNVCTPLGPCEDLGKGRKGRLRLIQAGVWCGGAVLVTDLPDSERERLPGATRPSPSSHEAPLTREEDGAAALGGVQGQLVEGEDLAPGLEDATPGAAAYSQSTHLGDRGRVWSRPPDGGPGAGTISRAPERVCPGMPTISITPLQLRRDEPDGTTAGQGSQCDPHTVLLSHTSPLTFSLGTSWTRTSSVMVPTTTAVLPSRPGSFIFRIWNGCRGGGQ